MKGKEGERIEETLEYLRECATKGFYFEITPEDARELLAYIDLMHRCVDGG